MGAFDGRREIYSSIDGIFEHYSYHVLNITVITFWTLHRTRRSIRRRSDQRVLHRTYPSFYISYFVIIPLNVIC